jgi:hypothetical protein
MDNWASGAVQGLVIEPPEAGGRGRVEGLKVSVPVGNIEHIDSRENPVVRNAHPGTTIGQSRLTGGFAFLAQG